MLETDPTKYQQWTGAPEGARLDGPISLIIWTAMRDFGEGERGVVEAFLLDCDGSGANCTSIAQSRKDVQDWSGGWGSWRMNALDFGRVTHTIPPGRSLGVRVVVGADSADDMWLAYGSVAFQSRLGPSPGSDNTIDCDFSDWAPGGRADFLVDDQLGPDDWLTPARLDVTRFGVSSNLVDSFYVLMAVDDVPPRNVPAASLVDTDLDGNANFALVGYLDGSSSAAVLLFSCDDSIAGGCGGALLKRNYPPSQFCFGTAPGPWNDDSMLEVALPFSDLGGVGELAVLTSLVSYDTSGSLISPQDSVLGIAGQDLLGRLHYDTRDGEGGLIGPLGPGIVIRRSMDPATVRTAPPHATVVRAPFDDLAGTLGDGASYFYAVEREGGLPLALSVHDNPGSDAVRIGFDDHDSTSAVAHPTLSSVSADLAAIPADGASFASITIVPRDANGVPLGTGCEVTVDESALAPGRLAGPVDRRGNGEYVVRVASLSVGAGDVVVSVEGRMLASRPRVTFTSY